MSSDFLHYRKTGLCCTAYKVMTFASTLMCCPVCCCGILSVVVSLVLLLCGCLAVSVLWFYSVSVLRSVSLLLCCMCVVLCGPCSLQWIFIRSLVVAHCLSSAFSGLTPFHRNSAASETTCTPARNNLAYKLSSRNTVCMGSHTFCHAICCLQASVTNHLLSLSAWLNLIFVTDRWVWPYWLADNWGHFISCVIGCGWLAKYCSWHDHSRSRWSFRTKVSL